MMKRDELMELEELIRSKSYTELNEEERLALTDMCADEAEFLAVKQLYQTSDAMKSVAFVPDLNPELKTSLDAVFAAKYPLRDPIPLNRSTVELERKKWFNSWLVRIAAMLVVVSTSVWMFLRNEGDVIATSQLAQNEITKEETVVTEKLSASVKSKVERMEDIPSPMATESLSNQEVEKPLMLETIATRMMTMESEENLAKSEAASFSPASRGMNADLYPQSLPSAPSLAQQKSRVLDMLSPMY